MADAGSGGESGSRLARRNVLHCFLRSSISLVELVLSRRVVLGLGLRNTANPGADRKVRGLQTLEDYERIWDGAVKSFKVHATGLSVFASSPLADI